MAYNRRPFGGNVREKIVGCPCGGKAKLTSRKNYPFGKKSTGITTSFYKCASCKDRIFTNGDKGGRK